MKKYQVVSVGSALRDVVFYTAEGEVVENPKKDPTKLKLVGFELGAKLKSGEVYFMWGGGAVNTAVNFAGLGLKTGVLAQVGEDMDGQNLIKYLKSKEVDTALVQKDEQARTGFSFLAVDQKTNEHVVFVYYGANENLKLKIESLKLKINTDWFYVSSLNTRDWPKIMASLIKTGKKIAWNPGIQQLRSKQIFSYLVGTEVFILNVDEATELCLAKKIKGLKTREMLRKIFSWGPQIVVITEGRNGAQVYDGVRFYQGIPHHGKPKDTAGAGDCFSSSLVSGLIKFNGQIEKSIKLAIINTTSLVMSPGANSGLLTWAQAKKKLP